MTLSHWSSSNALLRHLPCMLRHVRCFGTRYPRSARNVPAFKAHSAAQEGNALQQQLATSVQHVLGLQGSSCLQEGNMHHQASLHLPPAGTQSSRLGPIRFVAQACWHGGTSSSSTPVVWALSNCNKPCTGWNGSYWPRQQLHHHQSRTQRQWALQPSCLQPNATLSRLAPHPSIVMCSSYSSSSSSSSSGSSGTSGSSSSHNHTTTTTTSSSSSRAAPRNEKGRLPQFGPSHKVLRAVPFTLSREAAAEAFKSYHGEHWYQSRQRPVLAKPFKETFLPFWVGSGSVRVEVRGAEVGHEHLVTRYDRARGRAEPRWETVWSRVQLHLVWERKLLPEEPEAQLYASWKYPRSDVEVLRPGAAVKLATPIAADILRASPGSGTDTRRVGPFTVEPRAARKLLMSHVESAERRRAEEEISRLTGAQQVRFVDLHCTWSGSTGASSGSASAASGPGGLDLSPVYVPAYVFSWWHGGAKVRTFVSGVNASAVSGVQVLDDTKLATLATAATTSLGLLLGLSAPVLLWGGLVLPFVAVGVVSRFWPLLRSKLVSWKEQLQQRWKETIKGPGYCEVDWNASFVHAFEAEELRRRHQEQRQSYWQAHGQGPFARGTADPREFFEQFMKDPFSWFEKHFAQQQQQQFWQQFQQQAGQQQQQQGGQQYRQQQYGGGRPGSTAAGGGPPGDPLGYYQTLGVKPGCSTQEVQAAFRGLALQHHPDRYSTPEDKERATKKFQGITEAYQVLRDPKKRQQYDAGQYHDRA